MLFFDSKKKIFYSFAVLFSTARVAELVDALDSKSSSFGVRVRFPPRVQMIGKPKAIALGFLFRELCQIQLNKGWRNKKPSFSDEFSNFKMFVLGLAVRQFPPKDK